MQPQDFSEYELMRRELQEIKNCITQYMGFVLGGSGFSVIGVWFVRRDNFDVSAPAFISLTISIIVILVLFIIYYKFHSHNRMAGYCKLLTQEIWRETPEKMSPLFGWEWCMARLRDADSNRTELIKIAQEIDMDGLVDRLEEYYDQLGKTDNEKLKSVFSMIWRARIADKFHSSWEFPLRITSIIFAISIIFVTMSGYFVVQIWRVSGNLDDAIVLSVLGFAVLVFQYFCWRRFLGSLYTWMADDGLATIDAYSIRFLPLRHEFLAHHGIKVDWKPLTRILPPKPLTEDDQDHE